MMKESSSEESSFEKVQAEFEFFDPTLDDVAAIQRFLRDWVGRDNLVDTSALAQVIGEQDTVVMSIYILRTIEGYTVVIGNGNSS
ncbi:uncharacterized protein Gasu_47770 [Galdieria sulphuraria]|uniref:Uncharacterized protein n=1 Tax=Galdieria sulphuraria TaxID=130081 RepID=M2XCH0_GALSU|nr:uncharacterized protein Gasu_47770 [Galdieria sulphuraria]EME27632.1 hypothetical protein Gasu_47770 [Galdieria sulphuraria]|eukprot:XP_005704152.1 hypothetical protein Gasu_47770 [Galdieria sulphuraria]